MSALESNHRARGLYREVKVVANGHSHRMSFLHTTACVASTHICITVTENCRRVKGIWMCFGGGGYVWSLTMYSDFPEVLTNSLYQVIFRLWKSRLRPQVQDL